MFLLYKNRGSIKLDPYILIYITRSTGLKVNNLGLGSKLGCHWLPLGAQAPKKWMSREISGPDQGKLAGT